MFHYKSNLKRPKGVFNKLKVQVNYKFFLKTNIIKLIHFLIAIKIVTKTIINIINIINTISFQFNYNRECNLISNLSWLYSWFLQMDWISFGIYQLIGGNLEVSK